MRDLLKIPSDRELRRTAVQTARALGMSEAWALEVARQHRRRLVELKRQHGDDVDAILRALAEEHGMTPDEYQRHLKSNKAREKLTKQAAATVRVVRAVMEVSNNE